MTDSQFKTLRQERRAMRGHFDERFDAVTQRFDEVETRLTKLHVQPESKPDKAFVLRTIALVGLTILIFRSFLLPI